MDKIIVRGGNTLKGKIPISGAKNSALTLIPCALLTDEPLTLRNLPRLADIDGFQHLMNQFGISTTVAGSRPEDFGRVMTLEATRITTNIAPYDLVRKMRASILVLGPMLARAGEATVSLPGGCAIGNRPIDLHLKALEAFGVEIEVAAGYVKAVAKKGIPGGTYTFPVVSVGATENALMLVVGYTDSVGDYDYNQALSEKRAARVVNHLQQACGWKPYRMLTPTGMAEADPTADNNTEEGKAQNRRVAINILVSKSVDGF